MILTVNHILCKENVLFHARLKRNYFVWDVRRRWIRIAYSLLMIQIWAIDQILSNIKAYFSILLLKVEPSDILHSGDDSTVARAKAERKFQNLRNIYLEAINSGDEFFNLLKKHLVKRFQWFNTTLTTILWNKLPGFKNVAKTSQEIFQCSKI